MCAVHTCMRSGIKERDGKETETLRIEATDKRLQRTMTSSLSLWLHVLFPFSRDGTEMEDLIMATTQHSSGLSSRHHLRVYHLVSAMGTNRLDPHESKQQSGME